MEPRAQGMCTPAHLVEARALSFRREAWAAVAHGELEADGTRGIADSCTGVQLHEACARVLGGVLSEVCEELDQH